MKSNKQIAILASLLSLFCVALTFAIVACTTVAPSTASVSDRVASIVAQIPNDVQMILVPVLQKNPTYAKDVALIGAMLPGLLQNGPVDTASIARALTNIPNLTAPERQDLQYIEIGLPAILQLVSSYTGKQLTLYTDPRVTAIVNAFCTGLVKSASAVTN